MPDYDQYKRNNNEILKFFETGTNVVAVRVGIFDALGNQITTFGGGTEYTDGGVPPANPVGGTIEWSDGANWQTVSDTQPLPVTVKNASLAVTGTFWQATQPVSIAAPVTVTSTDLDIRDLTKATDSVQIWANTVKDGTGTNYIPIVDADGNLQVDVLSSALPTGASTLAEQQSQTTLLGTIDADTGGILTAIQLIDNAVDGNYLNVNLNIAGIDVSAGAGVLTAQTQRVTIATDDEVNNLLGTIDADTGNIVTSVQLIDDAVIADDAAFTPATTKVIMAGYFADETSTDSVNEGDGGAARMTLDRRQIMSNQQNDDTAWAAASKVGVIGFVADETATDSVDEGDVGYARMTLTRKQITASQMIDDAAWVASGYVNVAGYVLDDTSTDVVDEGDVGYARIDSVRSVLSNIGGNFPTFNQKTSTSTAAVQIDSTSVNIRRITITALPSNIEIVYIGGSGVTTGTGFPLLPGGSRTFFSTSNLNAWYYIKANAQSQGVSYDYS